MPDAPELGEEQQAAVEAIRNWYARGRPQVFRVFGYAGTGKTTVVLKAIQAMGLKAVYAAYTGKAASVMRSVGIPASTIHRMIYDAKVHPVTGNVVFHFNPDGEPSRADIIVIDECSMVGDRVANHLRSYGKPIIVLGDPAQLPPVEGAGAFTSGPADVMLRKVYRQDSESPVLSMATKARRSETLPFGKWGDSEITEFLDLTPDDIWSADQVLVGTNQTKDRLNRAARAHYGMTDPFPQFGEKVICTKNNYHHNIMNGETFIVVARFEQPAPDVLRYTLARTDGSEDVVSDVLVSKWQFDKSYAHPSKIWPTNVLADLEFGYAITVHRAQGSQWDKVLVVDESRFFREAQSRWLYTAITRAAKSVIIAKGRTR